MESIRSYLAEHKEAKTKEIAEYLGLSPARTRAIIGLVDDIEGIGNTSNRRYHLKDNSKA
jgi:Mn-dependent DtxR family transcriptional regulator